MGLRFITLYLYQGGIRVDLWYSGTIYCAWIYFCCVQLEDKSLTTDNPIITYTEVHAAIHR